MCRWCIRYQKAERLSIALERACKVRACKVRASKVQEEAEEQSERLTPFPSPRTS